MELRLQRFSQTDRDTLGLLSIDGAFACFTLEDEHRSEKVLGETRIPAGTYSLDLRQAGSLNQRYLARFGPEHQGMIWLRHVPGFRFIYIHTGNRDAHTDGCILVGDQAVNNILEPGSNNLLQSRPAYQRVYPVIAGAIRDGELCTIKIENEDGGVADV